MPWQDGCLHYARRPVSICYQMSSVRVNNRHSWGLPDDLIAGGSQHNQRHHFLLSLHNAGCHLWTLCYCYASLSVCECLTVSMLMNDPKNTRPFLVSRGSLRGLRRILHATLATARWVRVFTLPHSRSVGWCCDCFTMRTECRESFCKQASEATGLCGWNNQDYKNCRNTVTQVLHLKYIAHHSGIICRQTKCLLISVHVWMQA